MSITYISEGDSATPAKMNDVLNLAAGEIHNVKSYGAVGDGVTDDSQAFLDAATAKPVGFFIPPGSYVIDSGVVDVDDYAFMSGPGVTLIIDGVPADYSMCFFGAYQISRSGTWSSDTAKYMSIINRFSGKTLARISSAYSDGDSHQIYLPIEAVRDGHGFMLRHGTEGGNADILYQDSASRDLFYFESVGDHDSCTWRGLFDTTPGVSGGFDAFMRFINTNGTGLFSFDAAPVDVRQSLALYPRLGATRKFRLRPSSSSLALVAQDTDDTDLATIFNVVEDGFTLSGTKYIQEDALPIAARNNVRFATNGSYAAGTLTWTLTDSSSVFAVGKLRVTQVGSGAGGAEHVYVSDFRCDGSTVTQATSSINTTPPELSTTLTVSSGQLILTLTYSGGLGGSARYVVDLEMSTNLR